MPGGADERRSPTPVLGWDRRTALTGAAGLLALAATYGIGRQVFGLFVPVFRAEFGLSRSVLGLYASAAQVGYLIMVVFTGVLVDRFGARLPVVLGCGVLAAGAALVACASTPIMLAVGVVAAGSSAGLTWAPFCDAVPQRVPEPGQGRALAMVNAGSPAGLVIAGGLVLALGDAWRVAWALFAVVGLIAAIVNIRILPSAHAGPGTRRFPPAGPYWFFDAESIRLFVVTIAVSLTSGAFFTFAPDIVGAAGLPAWSGPGMWVVLGIAGGTAGLLASDVVDRVGLRRSLVASQMIMAIAMLLLLISPGRMSVATISAAIFGIGFTAGFAFVVLWSQAVFAERPALGFTATIVFIATGFAIGPAVFGFVDSSIGQQAALVVTASPTLGAMFIRLGPRRG